MKRYTYIFILFLFAGINFASCDEPEIVVPDDIIYNWQSNPQYSPDGEKIVFEGLYDSINAIHFISKDGLYLGHILRDVKKTKYTSSPTWGPNNSIAVSIEGNLFIADTSNDSLKQLTYSGEDFSCTWSKDGRYIAYDKTICNPECGITIYDLEKNTKNVIAQYGGFATWNRSSERIYYYNTWYIKKENSDKSDYKGFIFKRINVNTLKVDSLFYIADSKLYLEDCTISPNEKEILFAAATGSPPQIYIWKINLEDGSVIKLTEIGGHHPAYSPDGQTIVYTNTQPGEGGLWIMNNDGSNKKRLTQFNK